MKSFDKNSVFSKHFDSQDRYYKLTLSHDFLGDLVLIQSWGGKSNSLGGSKTTLVSDFNSGLTLIDKISRQRFKRGYTEISLSAPHSGMRSTPQKYIFKKSAQVTRKPNIIAPPLFIHMLIRFQKTIPHYFNQKYVNPVDFILSAIYHYPEYYPNQIENFLRQWFQTPIYIGKLFLHLTN
jgi:hypothetical protein